jgi:hypothetical protein
MRRADIGLLARDAGLLAGSALAAQSWAAGRRGAATGATVGFNSLVSGQLLYSLACSSRPGRLPGGALTGSLVGSFAAQVAALFLPGLRHVAGRRLGFADFSLSTAAGLAPLLAIGALDGLRR